MKSVLISACFMVCGILLHAQTLFTYKGEKVEKEEFLRAFYKNNTGDRSEQAMRDYLNLFIAFKLKVKAAKDMRLDTLPGQKNDLQNFRAQLEEDYTNDEKVILRLTREAFERSQKDIRLSHIFIPFDKNATRRAASYSNGVFVDTAVAFDAIQQAYSALNNKENFADVAVKYSQDPSVETNKGNIGYITVFTLPYVLENIAYNLNTGTYSSPYKSNLGYHIIMKTGERAAYGKMRAAQILLVYSAKPTAEEKTTQLHLADSLYSVIVKGGDFEALARQYSGERNAAATGGLMPEFGVGRYEPEFENAVFSLQKDADVTKPFETSFGIHIVKRIKYLPVATDTLQMNALFKDQVLQDSREKIAKEQFAKEVLNKTGYKKIFENDDLLWTATDSFLNNNRIIPSKKINGKTVLFSVDTIQVTMNDWAAYAQESRRTTVLPYNEMMKQFVSVSANNYYRNHLEKYDSRFRDQVTEFSDGNLLFEVMERKVWNKAGEDKVALKKYYEEHKSKYMWGESAGVIFFTVADKLTAEEMRKDIQTYLKKWKGLAESTSGKIIADSARFDLSQIPGNGADIQPGKLTEMVTDSADGTVNFAYIINTYKGPDQKSFEEARGLVINDYQAVLEEKWLAELKKKYPVKVNEKVFKSLVE
ncbi:MAG: peptidylprolyl isomerase [Chitinophagaceae bacterium]|nr:peptidylprolyl isomerase [Chitinophagaceae bacterium]